MSNEPTVLRPPAELFESPITTPTEQTISAQKNVTFMTKGILITETQGILNEFDGLKHPSKGWPFPEAVWACNVTKRTFMAFLGGLASWHIIPSLLLLAILPWKYKIDFLNQVLVNVGRVGNWVLTPFYLQNRYYTPSAKELRIFTDTFLQKLEISAYNANIVAKIISTIIEYDNAYRYRMQDIFNETTKQALMDQPRQELVRLATILAKRDQPAVAEKFVPAIKLFSFILFHPRIKRAFKETVFTTNLEALQMDEADKYHCLPRGDYMFFGRTFEDRTKEWNEIHGGKAPEPVVYKVDVNKKQTA